MASSRRDTTTPPAGGLASADVEAIRRSLAAGRRPTVVFTPAAGQIAGQSGQVVRLADPAESDDYVLVRFGDGGRDELPFAPADVTLPPRGRRTAADPGTASGRSATKGATSPPAKTPAKGARKAPAKPPAKAPAKTPAKAAAPSAPETLGGAEAAAQAPTPAPARAKRAVKGARRPAAPPSTMTVTLSYQDGGWTVGTAQGSKALAKPRPVRSADALRMVALLDVPEVHDAVERIVSAELAEAERRERALRDELAEVEARIAGLRDADR